MFLNPVYSNKAFNFVDIDFNNEHKMKTIRLMKSLFVYSLCNPYFGEFFGPSCSIRLVYELARTQVSFTTFQLSFSSNTQTLLITATLIEPIYYSNNIQFPT